jgi:hypothetical protein
MDYQAWADNTAAAMRDYYEANKPIRWWQKRRLWNDIRSDDLMLGLLDIALTAERERVVSVTLPEVRPYRSQAEAWDDALEKSAQIVERYNAAFEDPECGGAPADIRALKRASNV